jgi:hypothetical protein
VAQLTVNKSLPLRGQSKGYRKHNAASGNYADVIATSDRCSASGAVDAQSSYIAGTTDRGVEKGAETATEVDIALCLKTFRDGA